MAQYDPAILQKYANGLYARANGIIAGWTLLGLICGGVGGLFLEGVANTGFVAGVIVVTAVVVGLFGYVIGSGRAFMLKFHAQVALCQRQIELNTRGAATSGPPPL